MHLDYALDLAEGGDLEVRLILVPTLDTSGKATLRVGVSIDDGEVQVLQDHQIPAPTTTTMDEQRNWNQAVMRNARGPRPTSRGAAGSTPHQDLAAGRQRGAATRGGRCGRRAAVPLGLLNGLTSQGRVSGCAR